MLYGHRTAVYSTAKTWGKRTFNCNHLPIIDDEKTRIALAFWREGCRLEELHPTYSFLSFYKVIESQFRNTNEKASWIAKSLPLLTDDALQRSDELRGLGIDVSKHLYGSGRCAIAHASLAREIVDPDIPDDRRRIQKDLAIIKDLAKLFILNELQVPNRSTLYENRDRIMPWLELFDQSALEILRRGEMPLGPVGFDNQIISVSLWPDEPLDRLTRMRASVHQIGAGVIQLLLICERERIFLVFNIDFTSGRIHPVLMEGGLVEDDSIEESDVVAYSTYFSNVLANRICELRIRGFDPVDCEIVVPVNIMPVDPPEYIQRQVELFRLRNTG